MTLDEQARAVRDRLLANMQGRRGFRRDEIDEETLAEWDNTWLTLIAAALRQQWEEAAQIAENKFNHRDPILYAAYRAGEFTLDHEAAGDSIAYILRQRAKG